MKKTILLLLLASLFCLLNAEKDFDRQSATEKWMKDNPNSLPHWLTPEEELLKEEFNRNFYPTDPPFGPIRQVAEFESMKGVLISYPLGIPYELVAEMSEIVLVTTIVSSSYIQTQAETNYQNNGVNLNNCNFLIAPHDSHWTRDYGPWFVFDGNNDLGVVNFIYNRPRPNDNDIPIEYADFANLELYGMSLIQTGGNYMCDGMGAAVSTDLVLEENPSMTQQQIDDILEEYCGITNYHVTLDPLDDYIKHVDCWGKYLDVDKILISEVPETDYRYEDFEAVANYFATTNSSYGTPYEVYRAFAPGGNPPTPYSNSLILNDHVFVALTGSQHDAAAIASYEEAMPGYTIVGINYGSWYDTDALHCRTHELADPQMLYIRHTPINGAQNAGEDIEINAYIHANSGEQLIADSILLHYKDENSSEFSSVIMENLNGDFYRGYIPPQDEFVEVSYFISAEDMIGKSNNHPYIGEADPHTFMTNEVLGLRYGDVDDNTQIQAFDAAITLQFTVGLDPIPSIDPLPWEDWRIETADVDGNDDVQAFDASLILQYVVGGITAFPVEESDLYTAPVAVVSVKVENNYLIFNSTGDLFGFEIDIEENSNVSFGTPEFSDDLHGAYNEETGNLALCSAIAFDNNESFLKIPFSADKSQSIALNLTVNDGQSTEYITLGTLDSTDISIVQADYVLGNFPNPFNPETEIRLLVKNDNSQVSVKIYNLKGEFVINLFSGEMNNGIKNIKWNGRDNNGNSVSSGIYYYKTTIENHSFVNKMLLLK